MDSGSGFSVWLKGLGFGPQGFGVKETPNPNSISVCSPCITSVFLHELQGSPLRVLPSVFGGTQEEARV